MHKEIDYDTYVHINTLYIMSTSKLHTDRQNVNKMTENVNFI
jgi:hypothetical protein